MSAVAINLLTFNYTLYRVPHPIMLGDNSKYGVPPSGKIDVRLIAGTAIFGLGWGLSGLCPGPGVICFFSLTHGIVWVISMAVGQIAFDKGLEAYQR